MSNRLPQCTREQPGNPSAQIEVAWLIPPKYDSEQAHHRVPVLALFLDEHDIFDDILVSSLVIMREDEGTPRKSLLTHADLKEAN